MTAIPQYILDALKEKGHPLENIGTFDNPIPSGVMTVADTLWCVDNNIVIDLRSPEEREIDDLFAFRAPEDTE